MPTKLSSVIFDGRGGIGKYSVSLVGYKTPLVFVPYSPLDDIAASAIETAKKRLIDGNKGRVEKSREDFNSPSIMSREEIFIPAKKEYHFKIASTLTMNDSYSFSNDISLRNKEKGIGIDYNVLLGNFYNKDKYFVQELKKVFGKHGNISANINTQAFCRSDISVSDEEKVLLKQHFEDNISQILSTSVQDIARKPA